MSGLCAATAAVIVTICTNAMVPSCMRVPPEAGRQITGRRSAVARSTARVSRSAAAMPTTRRGNRTRTPPPPPAEQPLPGDHRFVQTGLPPGFGQVGGVGRIRPHVDRVSVPRPECARVQQQGKQIMRVHRAAPGHARIAAQPAPATGGECPAPRPPWETVTEVPRAQGRTALPLAVRPERQWSMLRHHAGVGRLACRIGDPRCDQPPEHCQ